MIGSARDASASENHFSLGSSNSFVAADNLNINHIPIFYFGIPIDFKMQSLTIIFVC